jgi:hypothetical protein
MMMSVEPGVVDANILVYAVNSAHRSMQPRALCSKRRSTLR